jgi:hypothetical protein
MKDSGLEVVMDLQISLQKMKEPDFLCRLSPMKRKRKRRREGRMQVGGEGREG